MLSQQGNFFFMNKVFKGQSQRFQKQAENSFLARFAAQLFNSVLKRGGAPHLVHPIYLI